MKSRKVERSMFSTERKWQKPSNIAEDRYPKLVSTEKLSIFQRLSAKFGMIRVEDQLFLGYCYLHKKYFLDHKHTNDVIRCPICDTQWLHNQGLIEKRALH